MDVRDLPKNQSVLFSAPFKDSLNVLYSISKALKPNGLYLLTFDDGEYEHENSFIIYILKNLFDDIIITKINNLIKLCVAKHSKLNPKLTSMNKYYFSLSEEKYIQYINSNIEERESILKQSNFITPENEETNKKIRKF